MSTISLAEELAELDPDLQARLWRRGFRAEQLLGWASAMGIDASTRNRLPGAVEGITAADVVRLSASEDLARAGRAAIEEGRVAVCVLAGGMATRMGGVVKALVHALPGKTFLDLRLDELAQLQARGVSVPMWLMTSEATDEPIRAALRESARDDVAKTFEQFVSLRLETDGRLFRVDGGPSIHATGHGDLPDALRMSGLLESFVAAGGRYLWISNLDNLGATVDEVTLGHHVVSTAPLTAEVVAKRPGDAGGGPVRHDGRLIIAETFRLPPSFDAASVPVFNTNSFIVDAEALLSLRMEWTYLEVHKTVAGRTAVQFERLLGELTMGLETQLVEVPRDGVASRFLPAKSREDLDALAPLIRERIERHLGPRR